MIDLDKLAAELHEAAVKKGFWDVDDAEEKHIAKMHSELSEAVQEDRCGSPMLYVDGIELMHKVTDTALFGGRKPEGVAAELADFVMMLLDWARMRDVVLEDRMDADVFATNFGYVIELDLPSLVNQMHEGIISAHNGWVADFETHVLFAISCIEAWLKERGVDLWQVIRLKMDYNKSRPSLHGRKY